MNISEADNIIFNGKTVSAVYCGETLVWPLNVGYVFTLDVSPASLAFIATGESKSITVVSRKQKTINGEPSGDPIEVPVKITVTGSGFTLSGNTITTVNNQSLETKQGTLTVTQDEVGGLSKQIPLSQAAGSKVYGAWSAWNIVLNANTTSIPATGGSTPITTSASRTRSYTWNGVAGTGSTETENGNPTLSKVSGDGTLQNNTVTYPNNKSTSSKSTIIRATMETVTKDITITQVAGAKVYTGYSGESWGTTGWELSTNIPKEGGSFNFILGTATRHHLYNWNGITEDQGHDTESSPTSIVSVTGGTVSGTTIVVPVNETDEDKTVSVLAKIENWESQRYFNKVQEQGAKIYIGNPVIKSFTATPNAIAATGGTVVLAAIATCTYVYVEGGTEYKEDVTITDFAISSGKGTISGSNLTATNNESTSANPIIVQAKYGSYVVGTLTVTQYAGAKIYGTPSAWNVNLTHDIYQIPAVGGTSTLTATATRNKPYTWNGVEGSGGTDVENGTPTLTKVSGDGTLSGNKLTYGNNTSTEVRETLVRATMDDKFYDNKIIQLAGAKVYGNWSAWSISLASDTTTIAAAGGTANITTNTATRTRTWTWNGVTGSGSTESENAVPTLTKVSGDSNFTGTKVMYGNNTSTSTRSTVIRATVDTITKELTITQTSGAKVYGTWSAWTVGISTNTTTVAAAGGSSTISTDAVRERTWTWNGVAGSGGTERETGTPTLTIVSGAGTLSGTTLTYSNNTSTAERSTVVRATYQSVTKDITITQSAGAKSYGSWSNWSITLTPSVTTIAATGGSSTINSSAVRTRTWTWNGVAGSGGTEQDTGTPSISKVSGDGTLSGTTLTYGNNTTTSVKSTVVRATMGSQTKDATITQSAGAQVFAVPTISQFAYDERDAAGGTLTPKISYSQTWTWNGVAGSGGTITTGGTYNATIPTPVIGASVAASTAIVTWTANQGAAREVTVSLTVTLNGKTSAAKTAVAKQNADTIDHYGDITISSFTVGDIAASGGTISSGNVSYVQVVYYTSGRTSNITSGATVTYSAAVSASNLGAVAKARTKVGNLTVTVSLNSKSSSKTADVYQAANAVTSYGNVTISGGSVSDIPASGGTISSAPGIAASQIITYTSGGTRSGSVSISYSTAITATSKGTTVSDRNKVGTLTATATGEGSKTATKAFDIYQAANSKSYGAITVSSFAYSSVAASGGPSKPSIGTITQATSFTSGSTSSETITGTRSFAIKSAVSGSSINTSTGAVTWSNNTTTSIRTVTIVLTVTANGKSVTKEATCRQAVGAKVITREVIDLNLPAGPINITWDQTTFTFDFLCVKYTYYKWNNTGTELSDSAPATASDLALSDNVDWITTNSLTVLNASEGRFRATFNCNQNEGAFESRSASATVSAFGGVVKSIDVVQEADTSIPGAGWYVLDDETLISQSQLDSTNKPRVCGVVIGIHPETGNYLAIPCYERFNVGSMVAYCNRSTIVAFNAEDWTDSVSFAKSKYNGMSYNVEIPHRVSQENIYVFQNYPAYNRAKTFQTNLRPGEWYLPSVGELGLLASNSSVRAIVKSSLAEFGITNAIDRPLWTCNPVSNTNVWRFTIDGVLESTVVTNVGIILPMIQLGYKYSPAEKGDMMTRDGMLVKFGNYYPALGMGNAADPINAICVGEHPYGGTLWVPSPNVFDYVQSLQWTTESWGETKFGELDPGDAVGPDSENGTVRYNGQTRTYGIYTCTLATSDKYQAFDYVMNTVSGQVPLGDGKWYLPAKDELDISDLSVQTSIEAASYILLSMGSYDISQIEYWSSTMYDDVNAYYKYGADLSYNDINATYSVQPFLRITDPKEAPYIMLFINTTDSDLTWRLGNYDFTLPKVPSGGTTSLMIKQWDCKAYGSNIHVVNFYLGLKGSILLQFNEPNAQGISTSAKISEYLLDGASVSGERDSIDISMDGRTELELEIRFANGHQPYKVKFMGIEKPAPTTPVSIVVGGQYGRLYNLKSGKFREPRLNGELTTLFNIYAFTNDYRDCILAAIADSKINTIYVQSNNDLSTETYATIPSDSSLDFIENLRLSDDNNEVIITDASRNDTKFYSVFRSTVSTINNRTSMQFKQAALRTYAPISGTSYMLLMVDYDGNLSLCLLNSSNMSILYGSKATIHSNFTLNNGSFAGIGYRKSEDTFIVIDGVGRVFTKIGSSSSGFTDGGLISSSLGSPARKMTVGENYTLMATSYGGLYYSKSTLGNSMVWKATNKTNLPTLELRDLTYNPNTKYHVALYRQQVSNQHMVELFNDVTGEHEVFTFPDSQYEKYVWDVVATSGNS